MTTPDFAEPVLGFRWWTVASNPPRGEIMRLVSPLYDHLGRWEPGKPFDAECSKHKHIREIPTVDKGHRCGVHAADSEQSMFASFNAGTICGQVEMGGRTMKYSRGYIAETARLKLLYLPPAVPRARTLVERMIKQSALTCAVTVSHLADLYGVPVRRFPIVALCDMYAQGSPELVGTVRDYLNKYGWKEAVDG